jgi:hypothetical protein
MAYENRVACHVTFDAVFVVNEEAHVSLDQVGHRIFIVRRRGISGAGSLIPFDAFDRLSSLSTALYRSSE